MIKKYVKFMSVAMVIFVLTYMLSACKKDDEETSASTSGTKSTVITASKTTARTTVSGTARPDSATASTRDDEAKTSSETGSSETGTVADGGAGNQIDDGSSQGDGGDGGSAEATPVSEEVYESVKIFDLKGRVIKVLISLQESMQCPIEDGTRQGEVRTKMVKEAEEKYNCKFVFEQMTSWANLQQSIESAVLAGVYYCDVFRMTRAYAFPKYELNNIILPLNEYIDFSNPIYNQYDQINGLIYPDKIYAFYICTPLAPVGVFYNKEIMGREGIPDIQELADSGQWTWETFADIAVKTTRDTDGDGIIDQWGTGADNAASLCIAFMRSNLAAMVDRTEDNRYVYNLDSPRALKALQFVSDLFHSYKVAPNKSIVADFKNGKAAMYVKDGWYGQMLKNEGITNLGFEIVPDGPDNPGNGYMRGQGSHMFFFPSNLEDPEPVVNAVAYWNVLWDESKSDYLTDEDMLLSNAQVWFDTEENINNFIDMVISRKIQYDYVAYFAPSQSRMTSEVFNKLAAERIAPMANIESIKNEVQSIIDDVMGY